MNFVVTYNFENTAERAEFVEAIEEVLSELGLEKEETNQSTYFGFSDYTKQGFLTALYEETNLLDWVEEDIVTVYYPKATDRKADIGRHPFKSEGVLNRQRQIGA